MILIERELIWSQATNPTDKLEHHSLLTHSGPTQLLLRLPIDDPINLYLVKVQMFFISFFLWQWVTLIGPSTQKIWNYRTFPQSSSSSSYWWIKISVFKCVHHPFFSPKLSPYDRPLWLQILQWTYLSITFDPSGCAHS